LLCGSQSFFGTSSRNEQYREITVDARGQRMASGELSLEDRDRLAVERLRFLVLSAVAQDVAEIGAGKSPLAVTQQEFVGGEKPRTSLRSAATRR
jgi:hypothetical protein